MQLQQLLLTCRRISITKLRLNVFIKPKCPTMLPLSPQLVLLDIDAYVSLCHTTPKHDQLHEVFDYNLLRNIAHELVKTSQTYFFETLAHEMLTKMLALPTVNAVRIVLQKPFSTKHTGINPDVVVEIFKIKPLVE